jgi:hypothetical protein
VCTAAAVLLLISYVAGAPVVAGVVQSRFPVANPIAQVFYTPLIFYAQHPELPGSELFASYAGEVEMLTMDAMR